MQPSILIAESFQAERLITSYSMTALPLHMSYKLWTANSSQSSGKEVNKMETSKSWF